MSHRQRITSKLYLPIFLVVSCAFAFGAPFAGQTGGQEKAKKDKDRSAKSHIINGIEGNPVLWKQPAAVESLDLFYGPGGREDAPNLSGRFYYVGPDNKGTQKKIYAKDDQGREWTVKFGPEARPETVATRIVWAMGYHTDKDYFVANVHIEGMPHPDAAGVRFKLRHDGLKQVGLWKWENNPFVGTRELDGLKVLMVLLNNWDLKSDNNKVLHPDKKSGEDRDDRIYYVGDLGATFGKTGSLAHELHLPHHPPAGTKDRPEDYARQSFIERTSGGTVRFYYKGKDPAALKGISVANARWMGEMLARLSDRQLTDAFRSGGYSDQEIPVLLSAIKDRIRELQLLQ